MNPQTIVKNLCLIATCLLLVAVYAFVGHVEAQTRLNRGKSAEVNAMVDELVKAFELAESDSLITRELNYSEAVMWLEAAALQGHAPAMNSLGVMFYHGRGVQQSYKEAGRLFGLAAQQNEPTAKYNIGVMYYLGSGVDENEEEAMFWFGQSAKQGNEAAKMLLDALQAGTVADVKGSLEPLPSPFSSDLYTGEEIPFRSTPDERMPGCLAQSDCF